LTMSVAFHKWKPIWTIIEINIRFHNHCSTTPVLKRADVLYPASKRFTLPYYSSTHLQTNHILSVIVVLKPSKHLSTISSISLYLLTTDENYLSLTLVSCPCAKQEINKKFKTTAIFLYDLNLLTPFKIFWLFNYDF
jgi:hypothetical protein